MRTLLLTGLAHLLVAASLAQHRPILPITGAPHGIFTMMQDRQSALWLGTMKNAVCFEGEHLLRPTQLT